jgi:2-keto-3-deoxy-L-rhamnonate aldolase RhmA
LIYKTKGDVRMLKDKLLAGQKIYGTMIRVVRNPALCHIANNAGLDFVMYDCEHADYTMETLHDLFLMGNALGLESFLRVPNLEKQYISRALDQGAKGAMVPMLETAEMAQKLVKYSKYQPIGGRGFAGGIAHTAYKPGKHSDVMENANNAVISIAQIETKQSIDNAESIAAVNGIDALLVGPNDLSVSLGIPGDLFNPIETEAIKHVADACKKHGKFFGLHAAPKMLQQFIDSLNIVMMLSDIDFLSAGFLSVKKTFGAD